MRDLFLIAALLVSSITLATGPAQAATVDRVGDTALGIFDLDVGGTLYDVEFIFNNAASIYGDPAQLDWDTFEDAGTASDAINSVLDAEGILRVGGVDARFFVVPYDVEERGFFDGLFFRSSVNEDSMDWVLFAEVFENTTQTALVFAVFTDVPEPSATLSLGGALAALGMVGRRRRRDPGNAGSDAAG